MRLVAALLLWSCSGDPGFTVGDDDTGDSGSVGPVDADGDGYGVDDSVIEACSLPAGYAGTGGAAKFEVEGMLKECLGKGPAHNVGEWKAVYSGRVGCAVVPNLTPDCDYHFRVRAFNRDLSLIHI